MLARTNMKIVLKKKTKFDPKTQTSDGAKVMEGKVKEVKAITITSTA